MNSGNIEIEIISESLSDHYLISPNDLHRGVGCWAGTTPAERCLLAALLTFRPKPGDAGWKASRASIDKIMIPLGRDAVTKVINGLRDKGFLVTTCHRNFLRIGKPDAERRGEIESS